MAQVLREVFSYIPREVLTRTYILRRLNRVGRLRNRVFHHEPIWHWRDLTQQHRDLLEIIGWISPAMLGVVRMIDRFPQVHQQGIAGYQATLVQLANAR